MPLPVMDYQTQRILMNSSVVNNKQGSSKAGDFQTVDFSNEGQSQFGFNKSKADNSVRQSKSSIPALQLGRMGLPEI